jgi:hypothetical protein
MLMDNELKTYLEAMEKRIVTSVGDRMRKIETSLSDGMIVNQARFDRYSYTLQEHEQWLRLEEHEATMQRIERNLELLSNPILKGRGSNGGSPESEGR